jgi:uncharacterized protein (DUF433 family)
MAVLTIIMGAPEFQGTRVPILALIDCLEGGDSSVEFLVGYPTVSKEQTTAFLEEAKEKILAASYDPSRPMCP